MSYNLVSSLNRKILNDCQNEKRSRQETKQEVMGKDVSLSVNHEGWETRGIAWKMNELSDRVICSRLPFSCEETHFLSIYSPFIMNPFAGNDGWD